MRTMPPQDLVRDRTVVVRTTNRRVIYTRQTTGVAGELARALPLEAGERVIEHSSYPDIAGLGVQFVRVPPVAYYSVMFFVNAGTEGDREIYVNADNDSQAFERFLESPTMRTLRGLAYSLTITVSRIARVEGV